MRQWVHDHSLSLAFGIITLLLYVCRQVAGFYEWDDTTGGWREQVAIHGEGVWEMLQCLLLIVFSKWMIERGSAESKE